MSNVLIFTSFPFVIFLLITPFLLRASSCSSSSSHFLPHPWRYDSSHLLAPIVLSELLTTSASISRLSLKHITSLPWNGSYHPHNSGTHTERADPTSLNLCWKPLRAPMKETQDPRKGSILRGNDKMVQGGGQMQIRKENVNKSVSVCKPMHAAERWDMFWLFRRWTTTASGPMTGSIFSASLHVNQHVFQCAQLSKVWRLVLPVCVVFGNFLIFLFQLILWNIALTGNIVWGGCFSMSQSAGQLDTLLITWHASVWLSANAQNYNEKEQIH